MSAPDELPTAAPTPEQSAEAIPGSLDPSRLRAGWRWLVLVVALLALFWALVDPSAKVAESWQRVLAKADLTSGPDLFGGLFLSPWFYAVFGLVVVLEWLVPARPEQRWLSRGLSADLVWVFLFAATKLTLFPLYFALLWALYDRHLDFLTIQAVANWPWAVKVVLALLVGDAAFWMTHSLRHRIRLFWQFHAVHHSQRELNFFSDYRLHPLDGLFVYVLAFIPVLMFKMSLVSVVVIVWLRHWHTRFYHSNIRTNLGILRYVLVTPQSHRIHHSSLPEHQDKNFGLTFSIWDQLFGTQYRGWDEYPETGITDAEFPLEQGRSLPRALLAPLRQLIYPFRALRRGSWV